MHACMRAWMHISGVPQATFTSRKPVPKLTKNQHFFVDCGIVLSFLINVSIFC